MEAQATLADMIKNTTQDLWGDKLPLQGIEREEFLNVIATLSPSDQDVLRTGLFPRASKKSIEGFLKAYIHAFSAEDHADLLSTMIYLYIKNANLTLKLCNDPRSLTFGDKVKIKLTTTGKQLELLLRLNDFLS